MAVTTYPGSFLGQDQMPTKDSGYFTTALEKIRDPIRTSHWRLAFDGAALMKIVNFGFNSTDNVSESEALNNLSLICESVTVPKSETNTKDSWWMGQPISFATNTTYDRDMTVEVQETADLMGYRYLLGWAQLAHNVNIVQTASDNSAMSVGDAEALINSEKVGVNLGERKFDGTGIGSTPSLKENAVRNSTLLQLQLFDYTTGNILTKIVFRNIYPQMVGSYTLSYDNPDLLSYEVKFHFDYFNIIIPNKTWLAANSKEQTA